MRQNVPLPRIFAGTYGGAIRRRGAQVDAAVNVVDLYVYAARCAHELASSPDDDEARDRVERAWLAIGADYFGTLRAVIAKADMRAGGATSVCDAMIGVANAAARGAARIAGG
jgi:hypothetical protein